MYILLAVAQTIFLLLVMVGDTLTGPFSCKGKPGLMIPCPSIRKAFLLKSRPQFRTGRRH
jgi:hypothetical protein